MEQFVQKKLDFIILGSASLIIGYVAYEKSQNKRTLHSNQNQNNDNNQQKNQSKDNYNNQQINSQINQDQQEEEGNQQSKKINDFNLKLISFAFLSLSLHIFFHNILSISYFSLKTPHYKAAPGISILTEIISNNLSFFIFLAYFILFSRIISFKIFAFLIIVGTYFLLLSEILTLKLKDQLLLDKLQILKDQKLIQSLGEKYNYVVIMSSNKDQRSKEYDHQKDFAILKQQSKSDNKANEQHYQKQKIATQDNQANKDKAQQKHSTNQKVEQKEQKTDYEQQKYEKTEQQKQKKEKQPEPDKKWYNDVLDILTFIVKVIFEILLG